MLQHKVRTLLVAGSTSKFPGWKTPAEAGLKSYRSRQNEPASESRSNVLPSVTGYATPASGAAISGDST